MVASAAGAYKGTNDDQLDKINVYFNEVGGSKSVNSLSTRFHLTKRKEVRSNKMADLRYYRESYE